MLAVEYACGRTRREACSVRVGRRMRRSSPLVEIPVGAVRSGSAVICTRACGESFAAPARPATRSSSDTRQPSMWIGELVLVRDGELRPSTSNEFNLFGESTELPAPRRGQQELSRVSVVAGSFRGSRASASRKLCQEASTRIHALLIASAKASARRQVIRIVGVRPGRILSLRRDALQDVDGEARPARYGRSGSSAARARLTGNLAKAARQHRWQQT